MLPSATGRYNRLSDPERNIRELTLKNKKKLTETKYYMPDVIGSTNIPKR